jgi:uncharacterized protein YdeI (YjbR/CyaY-like superfamily)
MAKDPRVTAFIEKSAPFARPILKKIRKVVHAGCPQVRETIKWGMPAFEHEGRLCGMAAFRAHATFWFWKAGLLGLGKTSGRSTEKAMGHFGRIRSADDLGSERTLITLVRRAASLNEAGVKVPRARKPKPAPAVPADLRAALRKERGALRRFEEFPPSHRREYVEWITEAKREETRLRRIETAVEWIAKGRSMSWKYER